MLRAATIGIALCQFYSYTYVPIFYRKCTGLLGGVSKLFL